MKLKTKFFGSILLMTILIVGLMAVTLQMFVYRNFADYINRSELAKLDSLVTELAEIYRSNGDWERLRANPRQWRDFVHRNLSPAGARPFGQRAPAPHHPPPAAGASQRQLRPPHRHPLPPAPVDPLQIGPRLSLFDAEKKQAAGTPLPFKRHTVREIQIEEKTVGWLGLKIVPEMYHPLDLNFLSTQRSAMIVICSGILILAAIVSLLLSRHLLAPIKKLTAGTRALATFEFDTRIDVTTRDELAQLARDFNHMAGTLKQYESMRKQWISDISHELRTPLAIIRGKIEAAQDGIRTMNREALDGLHQDVMRLARLVNDLHLLSLADSATLHLQKKNVHPIEILTDTLDACKTQLARHGIELRSDCQAVANTRIEGDKDRLKQLFENLVVNTIDYTRSPGVLEVTAHIAEPNLVICFQDTPPGVAESDLERIFDRLYRVDRSRSRKLGGSGLGLSICKQIVEGHGGEIHAARAELGGLKVRIALPLLSEKRSRRHAD